MSARASTRVFTVLLAVGSAPAVMAMDAGQSAPTGSTPTPALSLPIFLDAARLPELQAAWRTRFGGSDVSVAAPIAEQPAEPETRTIDEARQTLTRSEQIMNQSAAVRDRAEELSRRFAISSDDGSASPAPDPDPAPVSEPDSIVTETASVTSEPAPEAAPPVSATDEAPPQIQKASATTSLAASGDTAPASMLGGPPVEKPAEAAPVIEDMAAPPKVTAKRPAAAAAAPAPRRVVQATTQSTGLFGIFSSWGSSEPEPEVAKKPTDPDKDPMLPREIRAFGWDTQP